MIDVIPDAALIVDGAEDLLLVANQAAANLAGTRGHLTAGGRHSGLYPAAAQARIGSMIASSVLGRTEKARTLLRSTNGEEIPVEVRTAPLDVADRNLVLVILRDLRPGIAVEQGLRESEARYRALVDGVPVAVVEKDYTELVAWMDALRASGVADLEGHLKAHPHELAEQFRCVTVVSANRMALQKFPLLGQAVEGLGWDQLKDTSLGEVFLREVEALWRRRGSMTCMLDHRKGDGFAGHMLLHWTAPSIEGWQDGRHGLLVFSDLTELRQIEQQLRISEERPRLALQGFNVGIWEYNFETGESYYSERWKTMLGYEVHEIGNRREEWLDRIHPDDRGHVERSLQAHLEGSHSHYESEHRVRCKDGSYRWVLSRGRAFFDHNGRPQRLLGAHADITDRRLSEEALRLSEARYRQLLEHSPIAIIEMDVTRLGSWLEAQRNGGAQAPDCELPSGLGEHAWARLRGTNEAAVSLMEAGSQAEVAVHFEALCSTDLAPLRRQVVDALWHGRHYIEGEVSFRTLAGAKVRAVYHWWVPQVSGRPNLEGAQLVLVDLSDIVRAEDALAAERERLSVTLRSMSEGVVTTDTDGRVQYLNPAAEQLLECAGEHCVGRRLGEICVLVHERTKAPVRLPDMETLAQLREAEVPPQTMLVGGQGRTCVVEGRLASLQKSEGRALGAVLVLRDMTERVRLEAEQLRSSKLESLGVLAGGIAHDFNNILTVVMGNLTLTMLDSQAMTAAGRWLKEAERGVVRARDLTQQLLTFAKGGEPVRTAVALADFVKETAEFALHGSKTRCIFQFGQALWAAEVDKGQVGQVVQNIVINANQAMPDGGLLRISLVNTVVDEATGGAVRPGRYLKLSIADTGTGIRPDHLARIFDPYFTTKPQGSGLGLATVYSIVCKHQGHVDVESQVGVGTTFHIWLPAAKVQPAADRPEHAGASGRTGRILFMDDEEPIRRLGQALLQSLGYEAKVVRDGGEVLREFDEARERGRPYDLVMLDLTVAGGMGGLAALQEIRRRDPSAKAIVTSGYSSDPVMGDYRSYGFQGMVPKPYRIGDLGRTIQEVLNGAA
ncbi:blue-light-activated protein [mine drainage metagenome]|uniref:Blue-light-activated protein n=1 Tax=mine drainage metagenome TaxID=410659 RepID=A0A1J5SDI4_9ZZZZ